MDLRGAVAFAILVGGPNVLPLVPDYILDKVKACEGLPVPEVVLDEKGRDTFNHYAEHWKMDWDTQRDLNRSVGEVSAERIGG